jgi:hypothetical protein
MLSPKAMNRVARSAGTGGTNATRVTANDVVAVRGGVAASAPLQVTTVVPNGKLAPDAGEHETETGARPPVGAGAAYITACDGPVTFSMRISDR